MTVTAREFVMGQHAQDIVALAVDVARRRCGLPEGLVGHMVSREGALHGTAVTVYYSDAKGQMQYARTVFTDSQFYDARVDWPGLLELAVTEMLARMGFQPTDANLFGSLPPSEQRELVVAVEDRFLGAGRGYTVRAPRFERRRGDSRDDGHERAIELGSW